MNRRRLAAAVFFSVVIVLVLGVMVYLQQSGGQQTVTVYMLRHAVLAGGTYSADDVVAVPVHAAEGDFNYEHRSAAQYAARYTQDLRSNDILREDDLVDLGAQVEIAVTLQSPPPLSAGDRVDVFATMGGGRQARIGQAMTVLTVSGGALTILVPVDQEEAWISVAASSIALHAARSGQQAGAALQPLNPADAVSRLCGSTCSEAAGGTPSP
ncbi:MAG TPA: hypothetical protein VG520_00275 [Candidatus Dormibacteraeota bacterium]|jgi:hypothetical protein|nr:hypothetical protein [Candidatus Dormibacteraeota bacterium]